MRKIILAAALAGAAFSSSAYAADRSEFFKATGIMVRAGFMCHNERILNEAEKGMRPLSAQERSWLKEGMHQFDAMTRLRGLAAACAAAEQTL